MACSTPVPGAPTGANRRSRLADSNFEGSQRIVELSGHPSRQSLLGVPRPSRPRAQLWDRAPTSTQSTRRRGDTPSRPVGTASLVRRCPEAPACGHEVRPDSHCAPKIDVRASRLLRDHSFRNWRRQQVAGFVANCRSRPGSPGIHSAPRRTPSARMGQLCPRDDPAERDRVQGAVGGAVAAAVESVPVSAAAAGR
jgi:hypothetical protein